MKNKIKIATAISAVLFGSTAFGVTGIDRLVFTPSIIFEKDNYFELTYAQADPTARTTFAPNANVAEDVNSLRFGYKHQFSDKFGLGFIFNNQPVGVDLDYAPLGSTLRGSVSAESYTALASYQATDRITAFGGIKYQEQRGNADLTTNGVPGASTFSKDSDTGFILGAAYSIPKIALRVSLTYESDLEFSHRNSSSNPVVSNVFAASGNTISATPDAYTLEFQSGIAKNTLLFGSIRHATWSEAQVIFLGTTPLSDFDDTTAYKLGIGRKFNDSISGSLAFNYEESNGRPSSPFSPQDGEWGVAAGLKFTAKDGFATSIGVQYRELGDTVTTASSGSLPFEDNKVVTVGLKFSKSFK